MIILLSILVIIFFNCQQPITEKDDDEDEKKEEKGISESNIIKTIDSAGNVGWYTSIEVSGSNVYISYYDDTNDDLKFAKSVNGGATW